LGWRNARDKFNLLNLRTIIGEKKSNKIEGGVWI